jgi:hypothetical protein
MNLSKKCRKALVRLNATLAEDYDIAKNQVTDIFRGYQPVTLIIRDREHFYKVVNWCNKNIGNGGQYWTAHGRVLRSIDPTKKAYNPPAKKGWVVKVPNIDVTPIRQM